MIKCVSFAKGFPLKFSINKPGLLRFLTFNPTPNQKNTSRKTLPASAAFHQIACNRPIPWRKQRKLNVMHGAWTWPWNSNGVDPAELGGFFFSVHWGVQKVVLTFFSKKEVQWGLCCQRKGVLFLVMLQKGSLNDGLLVVFRFGLVC